MPPKKTDAPVTKSQIRTLVLHLDIERMFPGSEWLPAFRQSISFLIPASSLHGIQQSL